MCMSCVFPSEEDIISRMMEVLNSQSFFYMPLEKDCSSCAIFDTAPPSSLQLHGPPAHCGFELHTAFQHSLLSELCRR